MLFHHLRPDTRCASTDCTEEGSQQESLHNGPNAPTCLQEAGLYKGGKGNLNLNLKQRSLHKLTTRVQEAGLYKGGKPPAFSPQDIVEFIFFPVVNEGCRVVAEGIVDKPADLDVATVLAMGFPPYR